MSNTCACPECSAVPPFAARVCPYCGHRFVERVLIAQDRKADTLSGYRCTRCKSPLIEGARYCATCGREFTDSVSSDMLEADASIELHGQELELQRKRMLASTLLQMTGMIVLAMSIIFVIFLCYR